MAATDPPTETDGPDWCRARRLAFRLVFLYAGLYGLCYLVPLGLPALAAPVLDRLSRAVFDRPVVANPTGSGDTWLDWMTVFTVAAVSVVGALLWSLLDRRNRAYPRLFDGLLVFVRFTLAATMLGYGFAKVLPPRQFPPTSPGELIEPLGSMSPMGLMWTFMGHSVPYTVFAGALEVLGALLLFGRRTALLGALVTGGVMANVAMLNLSYDVPVKQYSLHIVALCGLVAAPHLGRLLRFFVLDRDRQRRRGFAVTGAVVAALLVAIAPAVQLVQGAALRDRVAAGPHDGVYDVVDMSLDGRPVPPLLTDPERWRRVGLGRGGFRALTTTDELIPAAARQDPAGTALTLTDADGEHRWSVARTGDGLVVEGPLRGRTVRATLRRLDDAAFVLPNRGFRWVQEYPFNR
jgi:hypothetical protein